MEEKQHAAFTKAEAAIENKVGGEFNVWDGYATGKNLELIPNKKIVQEWRASDWDEGLVSKVTFELFSENEGTKLVFSQENIPHDKVDEITNGWKEFYWEPLQNYFKDQNK